MAEIINFNSRSDLAAFCKQVMADDLADDVSDMVFVYRLKRSDDCQMRTYWFGGSVMALGLIEYMKMVINDYIRENR